MKSLYVSLGGLRSSLVSDAIQAALARMALEVEAAQPAEAAATEAKLDKLKAAYAKASAKL